MRRQFCGGASLAEDQFFVAKKPSVQSQSFFKQVARGESSSLIVLASKHKEVANAGQRLLGDLVKLVYVLINA